MNDQLIPLCIVKSLLLVGVGGDEYSFPSEKTQVNC